MHYDELFVLARCLFEYERQTLDKNLFEIIVADVGTPEGVKKIVDEFRGRMNVRLVVNPRTEKKVRNPANVINTALAACWGSFRPHQTSQEATGGLIPSKPRPRTVPSPKRIGIFSVASEWPYKGTSHVLR